MTEIMFQTIHDIDLKDRLRSKKARNPWENDLKPYHRHYYHARRSAKEQQESTIGITNLFILATAALETSFPKNSTTTSTGPATATQIIHAEIESISSHLSSLNDHIHTFNGPAIIQHLELFSEKLMHMGNHIASAAASAAAAEQQDMTATTTTTIINDAKTSLTLIFYIKHALQPYNRETLFQLRKTKGRISRLGLLDDVTLALREVCEWMRVLGTVVMVLLFSSSSGGNHHRHHHQHHHHHHELTHAEEKRRRWMVQGREVWEGIGRDWEEIVRYFQA